MSDIIISIKDLRKTYRTESESLTILNDLSIDIEKGKKIVIAGESGSGKSTFLNIVGALDNASAGSIIVGPYNVGQMDEEDAAEYRNKFLGLIFQFHYLLKDFTALENVYLPAFMAGVNKKEAEEKALKLLDDVGLSSRVNHLPSELSGGERQRVAVARALINDPQVILADEPTGNLDPANAVMIGDLLFSMADKYQKTLLLVTHDMNLASKGDKIYSIKEGKLNEF
ncbi:MAG TPA: lipoprotein-releasing system ATP-binding protein LolD [Treponema sp.]|nr:lipoprotein-releasing system ATP-binding protein LolD [Treponema sp.]